MKKLALGVALAALPFTVPAAAPAQRLNPAVVAVVDVGRVSRECTACRAAATQIEGQVRQLETRAQQLRTPLQTEAQSLQTAVAALQGKQPDAALRQRIEAFQTRENNAQQELGRSQANIRSIEAHVNQQISQRLEPIVNQVMQTRGATVVVSRAAALAVSPSIDVTNDVLALLNQQLPSVSVTPLPQTQQQQQQPQGR